jgi:hypothetical protein
MLDLFVNQVGARYSPLMWDWLGPLILIIIIVGIVLSVIIIIKTKKSNSSKQTSNKKHINKEKFSKSSDEEID